MGFAGCVSGGRVCGFQRPEPAGVVAHCDQTDQQNREEHDGVLELESGRQFGAEDISKRCARKRSGEEQSSDFGRDFHGMNDCHLFCSHRAKCFGVMCPFQTLLNKPTWTMDLLAVVV